MYIEWGERMNRQNNRQKGVMLVFTAIMLPIIFILCGLVYDLGLCTYRSLSCSMQPMRLYWPAAIPT